MGTAKLSPLSASSRRPACPHEGGTCRAQSPSSLPQSPSSLFLSSSQQAERLTLSLAPQLPADRALGSVRSPMLLPTAPAHITIPRNVLVWLIVQVPLNQMDMPICPSKSQIAGLTGHPDQSVLCRVPLRCQKRLREPAVLASRVSPTPGTFNALWAKNVNPRMRLGLTLYAFTESCNPESLL
ncbi:hypothetical protein P7K49_025103 [Saguinus oedipus]|uniref:Uncharacterized protein n=1 Tax=Saguinus oedipus TaxID=9490 RepID=A0ABQ9UGY7_SAGOE|nr:hypothetical protein P7K49_025103 [Saguinus oedipus]